MIVSCKKGREEVTRVQIMLMSGVKTQWFVHRCMYLHDSKTTFSTWHYYYFFHFFFQQMALFFYFNIFRYFVDFVGHYYSLDFSFSRLHYIIILFLVLALFSQYNLSKLYFILLKFIVYQCIYK